MVKSGETPLQGEGHIIIREILYVLINVYNGPMETAMLNTCG